VYLDDAYLGRVDLYSATPVKRVIHMPATTTPGTHTLRVQVLGTKRAASSGTRVDIDAFVFLPLSPLGVGARRTLQGADVTSNSSTLASRAAFVTEEATYTRTPTAPGPWSSGVESVAVNCHALGSLCPSAQTFTLIVVGLLPVT